jgi:hypothetical protein
MNFERRVLSDMADYRASRVRARAAGKSVLPAWNKPFLIELAATSNVAASARAAGVHTRVVYEARRSDTEFARHWQVALCEGYELLEMELLARLREGEIKPRPGAKRGVRAYDNATALRLLGAHRENAARARAIREDEDTDAILAGIDAKLERMRVAAQAMAKGAAGDGD